MVHCASSSPCSSSLSMARSEFWVSRCQLRSYRNRAFHAGASNISRREAGLGCRGILARGAAASGPSSAAGARFTVRVALRSSPGETGPTARFSRCVSERLVQHWRSVSKVSSPCSSTRADAPRTAPVISPSNDTRATDFSTDTNRQARVPFSTASIPASKGRTQASGFQRSPGSTPDSGSNAPMTRLSPGECSKSSSPNCSGACGLKSSTPRSVPWATMSRV